MQKKIKASKFIKLYRTKTNKEVALEFQISDSTVMRYARRLGISKGKGNWAKRKPRSTKIILID